MTDLNFDPTVTVAKYREAGVCFGNANRGLVRLAFEAKLMERLLFLEASLIHFGTPGEDAVAAFDNAAWQVWEETVE